MVLDEPGKGLHVGPFVWQELTDFSAGAVVLVLASMPYEDAEFISDYDEFKRLAGTRVA